MPLAPARTRAGTKAQLQKFSEMDEPLSKIVVGANVTMDKLIVTPVDNTTAYTGPLKTGFLVCPLGTEAYIPTNGGVRIPNAGSSASYPASVVADNSCRPCDANLYAAKIGACGTRGGGRGRVGQQGGGAAAAAAAALARRAESTSSLCVLSPPTLSPPPRCRHPPLPAVQGGHLLHALLLSHGQPRAQQRHARPRPVHPLPPGVLPRAPVGARLVRHLPRRLRDARVLWRRGLHPLHRRLRQRQCHLGALPRQRHLRPAEPLRPVLQHHRGRGLPVHSVQGERSSARRGGVSASGSGHAGTLALASHKRAVP